jgi:pimeloyl-ACP methyl ester carboxylesterase
MYVLPPPRFEDLGAVRMAWRAVGTGEPLVMLHGWPFSSLTFRKLAPLLAPHRRLIIPDLPGAGETEWTPSTDFGFRGQAETLRTFLDRLGLTRYALLAHDTGATLARMIAQADPGRVSHLVLLNTEMAGHRPPWIPFYARAFALPGASAVVRMLLGSERFVRSPAGFGGCFADPAQLDDEFRACFIRPVRESAHRAEGLRRYLCGVDWDIVDDLRRIHGELRLPVLVIWGAEDPTFPLREARQMVGQLPDCRGLVEIPAARLLVHEEKADDVARHTLAFLREAERPLGADGGPGGGTAVA